jgi:hypothetical protein
MTRHGLTGGIAYYTDCRCPEPIFSAVINQLEIAAGDREVVSVSLGQPVSLGDNIILNLERSYLTMFRQQLMAISELDTDFVFLCEHDVLYHPSHFEFVPPRDDVIFYNQNVWRLRADTGEALFHYHKSVSQLCANRRLLIDHYRERIAQVEAEGFNYKMGFEPGTRKRSHGGIDDLRSDTWMSPVPNIDIHTGRNLTRLMWEKSAFRNQKFTAGWLKSSFIPGWPGAILGRFDAWLAEIMAGSPRTV